MDTSIDDLVKSYAQKLYDERPTNGPAKDLIISILTKATARILRDLISGKLNIPGHVVISEEQDAINEELRKVSEAAGYKVDVCHKCQKPQVSSQDDFGECDDCSLTACSFCNNNPSAYKCPHPEERDSSSD